jgi:hypothetical protein
MSALRYDHDSPMRPGYERWIVAALAVLLVVSAYALRFTVDDAYIAMRYSRNLAEGRGLVYNAGEYVEGYTSPLWVLVLAAAHGLGFNMVSAAHGIGIALSVLTLLLVYHMLSMALPDGHAAGRLLPALFLATSWIYAGWATGGLETALYACVAVLGVSHLQSRALEDRGPDWLPLISVAIVLTRPEGFLLAGVLGLASLVLDVKRGGNLAATVGRWALLFALPVALFVAWRLSYYGEWLPNTFYVKVNKVEYVDRGWPFFLSFARDSLFYLWGLVALAAVLFGGLVSISILAYSAAYILYTIWVGGDWMGYRFYHHLLPLLSVPMGHVVARAIEQLRPAPAASVRSRASRAATPVYRVAAAASLVAVSLTIGATAYKRYAEGRATELTMGELDNYEEMDTPEEWAVDVGWGLDRILQPDEAASASFAGFTAVYTNRTIVDSLGLTDKYVARLPAVRGGPGHEKFAPPEYLVSRNVLLVNPWPGRAVADSNRQFVVEHAPGYYVYFDALVPPYRVAEVLLPRGFSVWAGQQKLFDRSKVENVPTGLNLDFESGTWEGWTLSGTAFGASPAQGASWTNAPAITGVQGRYFVNTHHDSSETPTGTARSRDFSLGGNVVHFLIAGGAAPGTALELWVDGKRVRTSSGRNSDDLVPVGWDVEEFRGRTVQLVIRDDESGPWGHIVVDDIQVARAK